MDTFDKYFTSLPLDLEATNKKWNEYLSRVAPKKQPTTRNCKKCTHWLITINCVHNDVSIFQTAVESMVRIPWIQKFYVYCYELGSNNSGLHIHLLAINNDNRKGRSIDQMFAKVKDVVANKNCIDVAQIFDSKISNVLKYLEKVNHPDQQLSNKEFRELNNLRAIYRSSKLI